jgi:hypothetical protein
MAGTAVEWLRFFDSVSLNLCRGQDSEPFAMKWPDGKSLEFDWLATGQVTCRPWPFGLDSLDLSLQARLFEDGTIQPGQTQITWHLTR